MKQLNSIFIVLASLSFSLLTSANNTEKFAGAREPGFIENKGQVINQYRQPQPDVLFIFATNNFKWVLRKSGFSYELSTVVSDAANYTEAGTSNVNWDDVEEGISDVPEHLVVNSVDVKFVNANKHISAEATEPVSYYYNYCTSNSPVYFVHLYKNIVYRNVYRGIDIEFTFLQGGEGNYLPEYKWIVHRNGDIKNIALTYEGAKEISIKKDGSLLIAKDIGFISECKPKIIFDNSIEDSNINFTVSHNYISFTKSKSCSHRAFTIDPTLAWGIYYGGNKDDFPNEIATSTRNGNDSIYVVGVTQSSNYIVTDPFNPTNCPGTQSSSYKLWDYVISGSKDCILTKFAANMSFQWATYYGGSNDEKGFAIAVDPLGPYVAIAGRTYSEDAINAGQDPATGNPNYAPANFAHYHKIGVNGDGFLAKFNAKGWLIRGLWVGGNRNDYFLGVAFDRLGNLYASGQASSSPTTDSSNVVYLNPVAHSVEQTECYANGDHGDVLLVKFKNDLSAKMWGTFLGDVNGNGNERGHNLTVDYNFNVYQIGTVSGDDQLLPVAGHNDANVFQPCKFNISDNNNDAFVVKWDSAGRLTWMTYFGGDGAERGRGIKTDDAGYIYALGFINTTCNPNCNSTTTLCGTNFSGAFPASGSTTTVIKTQMDANDSNDGFLAKFEPLHGARVWSTYFGGSKTELTRTLAVNPKGAPIYIGGWTKSAIDESPIAFPITVDATQKILNGTIGTEGKNDFYLAKLNWNATKTLYCSYFGGNGDEGNSASSDGDWYQGTMDVDHTTGDIYITSYTNSTDSIAYGSPSSCFSSLKTNNPGTADFFIAKLTDACSSTYRETYAGDAFEPNNCLSGCSATNDPPLLPFPLSIPNIPAGKPVTFNGKIFGNSDLDYFKIINVPGSNTIIVDLTVPANVNYNIRLFDNNFNELMANTGNQHGNAQSEQITLWKTAVGNTAYYIEVYGNSANDTSSLNCYSVTVTPQYNRRYGEFSEIDDAFIFPNPSQNNARVEVISNIDETVRILIFNVLGQEVFNESREAVTGVNFFDLPENMAQGDYFVCVESQKSYKVLKWAVIH